MDETFVVSPEYRQLNEKWYNDLDRAKDDLAKLDPKTFADQALFLLAVVKMQAEIKVIKQHIDDVQEYFKPEPVQNKK